MKHETNDKGDIGVSMVTADLIERGISVFLPVSSASPFDLLGYDGAVFNKIQVKYRKINKGGVIHVQLDRAIIANSRIVRTHNHYIDIMAIYCPDTKKCYYIRIKEGIKAISLRFQRPKSNQFKKVRFAEDYLSFPLAPLA